MNFIRKRFIKIASLRLLFPAISKAVQISRAGNGKKKVITSLTQHLGDNIAAEPLDTDIKLKHPDKFIVRIVNSSFLPVVSNNPHIDLVVTVSCLSEWVYLKPILKMFYKVYDYHIHKSFCGKYRLTISNPNAFGINAFNYYSNGNLLQVFCKCSGHDLLNAKPICRLPPGISVGSLPEKYVLIHVSSNNEQREWANEKWLGLVDYFATKNVAIVEVGLKSQLSCNHSAYHNFCGKLSINQIAYTISRSTFFVGIDSAFAHFANAFNVPRLILLGHFNNFTYYLPYSGLTEMEEAKTIIHYTGPVKELPLKTVIEKIHLD